ncbi:hypothetical protein RclHR1_06810003 [Rhizophagus clarus]|uniref:Protein kinase domain-containing protein n=1 Tax=Rhizophagus clarus TaxID=94130 RepID=A0A2Z6RUG8_9GLOM|nr:hypothetical protein RclHR1_06810003 [Rhizophagus clarus]
MELLNICNNKDPFDLTPRLKSSPVPIQFIPFNANYKKCNHCGNKYSETLLFRQKFCKSCFKSYFKENSTNVNECLDVHIRQCKYTVVISHFKQIIPYELVIRGNIKKSEKYCKLCGKLIYQQFFRYNIKFITCPDCYKISHEWIESTLTKKSISIFIYLDQSQCKKCKRISIITVNTIRIEKKIVYIKVKTYYYKQIINYITEKLNPFNIYNIYTLLGRLYYRPLKPLIGLFSYSRFTNLENNDPYPPIPIIFIPFDNKKDKCHHCKRIYSTTILFKQKYCEDCLFLYITNYTDNNFLDECISTESIQLSNLEFHCSEILYFKQIVTCDRFDSVHQYKYDHKKQKIIESKKYCKLCGNLIYNIMPSNSVEFKLCPNCYQISSGWIESTLTKNVVPVLYLPWWDTYSQCIGCDRILESNSDNQKMCSHCMLIYIGCRFCLTTNIIFGITDQSQCKKCKRVSFIKYDTKKLSDTNENLYNIYDIQCTIISDKNNYQIANYANNHKNPNPLDIYNFVKDIFSNTSKTNSNQPAMKEIPYSQVKILKQIAKGGFGVIYKANLLGDDVVIKRFNNSQNISKHFLNEAKSLFLCYNLAYIIKVHGITQDPETKDYMLVMEYASGGDLHKHLQKNFVNITWNKKIYTLWKISEGLNAIHKKDFMHRDFHSGNILLSSYQSWLICDLGLSQPANNTSSNNEIYGVIPYIAPEIFKGSAFSKESDIYSLGMIMWELTTGCKPLANIEHNIDLILEIIDGKRPDITNDTPECFSNLMKRCWNSDPSKRPSMTEITKIFGDWYYKQDSVEQFEQAERKRLELMQMKQLGPEFCEKPHPGAIFTSRPLSSFISKSSSLLSLNIKQDNKLIESSEEYEYISNELGLDIDTSRPQKRNISEVLQIETQDHGKHIKLKLNRLHYYS